MDGWSEVVAQLEHGMVTVDLPALPPGAAVPLVRTSRRQVPLDGIAPHLSDRQWTFAAYSSGIAKQVQVFVGNAGIAAAGCSCILSCKPILRRVSCRRDTN